MEDESLFFDEETERAYERPGGTVGLLMDQLC